ncbi:flavin monoamine oxidase family protein [Microbacterium gorillae]|uniref:flavin monoamine oxidase family protein n=1 Tax=Microbacterium gorillae TaxID=1231063 RepID=UPI00058AF5EF|nr:NAD(P)/FAD-dependent oxidoreductase [Microbacterium gorillae]
MTAHDVIIVGAGFAGLRAARDLKDRGITALVLEGRDRLGGRTWRRPFRGTEQPVELGGTWISDRAHHLVMAELERYGIGTEPGGGDTGSFVWDLGGDIAHAAPLDADDLYALERAWVAMSTHVQAVESTQPRDRSDLAALDVSVRDYLLGLDLTPRVRLFLETFGSLGGGAAATDWSALSALSLMAAHNGSVFSYFAGISHKIAGGTTALIEALAADASAEIRLDAHVTGVIDEGDLVTVTTADGERLTARSVIVTAPVNTWRDISFSPALGGPQAALAAEGQPNRMVKLWIRAEGMPEDTGAISSESEIVAVIPQYRLGDSSLVVAFSSPPHLVDPTDRDAVTAAFTRLFPDARVIDVDVHDWNTDPFSRGAWMTFAPGQLSTGHSGFAAPSGRILFAGSDVAIRWPGWIDGALETGAAAATAAAEVIGR